ncbi:short-chain dehydrogenase [Xylaria sp. CBS 124048]|nr:short-chain dehydrogenase [Xylaria sp. CBS 124048]
MGYMSTIRQLLPGKPGYTEKDLPDLSGKVYLVTGANTGIGKDVARLLYAKNATVYITTRTAEKGTATVAALKALVPASKGRLEALTLELSDLATIKSAAAAFTAKETRLDVLFNNAGVMFPPAGSKTAQGHELQLGTNCLGHFLLTQLLTPVLVATAKNAPRASVRVVWVSSSVAEVMSPKGGVELDNLDYKRDVDYTLKYGISKAGLYYLAAEFARQHREDGIISVALNPGNIKSDIGRTANAGMRLFRAIFTYPTVRGAYTQLFAAISKDVGMETSGGWIVPWGRIEPIRKDLADGAKSEKDGGTGIGRKFWEWSEQQTKAFS